MLDQTPVQIAWVTNDLTATETTLSALLGVPRWFRMAGVHFAPDTCTYRGEPADCVADISLSYAGDMQLEVIAPTWGDSVYSEFLERCGPGLHHICRDIGDSDAFTAALDEAARHQAALAKVIGFLLTDAIHRARVFFFPQYIQRLSRLHLHTCGHLIVGNAGVQNGLVRSLGFVKGIQRINQIAFGRGHTGWLLIIRLEMQHRRAFALDRGALKKRRKIPAHPVLNAIHCKFVIGISQHHVGRKILVHATQTISNPRTHCWMARESFPALPFITGRLMVLMHIEHRPDNRNLINLFCRVRQQLTYPCSTLPVLRKLPVTAHDFPLHTATRRRYLSKLLRGILAVILFQRRLWVKKIHL